MCSSTQTLTPQNHRTATALLGGAVVGLSVFADAASAADFKTVITFPAIGNPQITSIEHLWSTETTTGQITAFDLTEWSYKLLDGTTEVYSEDVVVGGVFVPIGGASRPFVGFEYDFEDVPEAEFFFDNDELNGQEGNAVGTTYNVFPGRGALVFRVFSGGLLEAEFETSSFSFFTSSAESVESVPEPGSLLGYITLGGLMLGGAVRRARR